MSFRPTLLVLALAAACASASGGAPVIEQSPFADRLDRYVAPLVQAHELSGSFLVTRGGRTLAERSYGMANREHAVPAASDTRYVIGSISKEFTAAAVVLLAQEGKLGLDDHLEKYVPGFPSGDVITLRQMLRHTSGISRDLPTLADAVVPHSTASWPISSSVCRSRRRRVRGMATATMRTSCSPTSSSRRPASRTPAISRMRSSRRSGCRAPAS